jgi:hypothetical protein
MQEYPQLQQQSQQQLQDSPQQLPLYQAPPQPQQQQQQRSVSDSLKVAFTGVLHALLEPGDSGWKIMKFKQVGSSIQKAGAS